MSNQQNVPEVENTPDQPKKAESVQSKPAVIPADTIPGIGSKSSWDLARVQAVTFSESTIIPKDFQKNPANCLIALNMASRLGADPLMVMQNLYIVHGNPGWSSQFLISTFNTCGRFSAIRYEFSGTPGSDDYGCRAWSVENKTGERLLGSIVTIAISKAEGWYAKAGSKWPNMPDQMLMYRAASWFVRAYAPEISMGLQTVEELNDTIDMIPNDSGGYQAAEQPQGGSTSKKFFDAVAGNGDIPS